MDESLLYDGNVAKNFVKKIKALQMQMQYNKFNAFYPISVVRFLSAFKFTCGTNGVHEEAAMWLLHFILKGSFAAALDTSLPNAKVVFEYALSKRRNAMDLLRGANLYPPELRYRQCYRQYRWGSNALQCLPCYSAHKKHERLGE